MALELYGITYNPWCNFTSLQYQITEKANTYSAILVSIASKPPSLEGGAAKRRGLSVPQGNVFYVNPKIRNAPIPFNIKPPINTPTVNADID